MPAELYNDQQQFDDATPMTQTEKLKKIVENSQEKKKENGN